MLINRQSVVYSYLRLLISFVLCPLFGLFSYSQDQKIVDSLSRVLHTNISDKIKVDTYNQLAFEYRNVDSARTIDFANKAIKLAREINYIEGTIDPLFPIGLATMRKGHFPRAEEIFTSMVDLSSKSGYQKGKATGFNGLGWLNGGYLGNYDKALGYLLQAADINEKLHENFNLSLSYNLLGITYDKQSNYGKALEYYLKAIEINKELGNEAGMASCYNNIAVIHRNKKQYEKALEYCQKSLKIYGELGIKTGIAYGLNNIANIYYQMGTYDKALDYHFQSLKIKEEIGDKWGIGYSYNCIGKTFIRLGDYPKSLKNLFDSLRIFQELGALADKSSSLIHIGEAYQRLGQLGKAKKYLKDGIDLAQKTKSLANIRDGAEKLSLIEKQMGDYSKAYKAHVLYKQMSDSIHLQDEVKEFSRLEVEFKFQKEKDSLKLLQQQEILLLEEKNKRRENRSFAIAVCLILVLITGTVIYFALSKAKRTKELDALRNHISRDLHDEVGSTLSSLALFGTVARSSLKENPEKTVKLLNLINTNATETVESMNDIIWAINSDEDSIMSLINKMRGFANELQDTGRFSINIDYDDGISDKKLDMIQRRNLYLIFKEAINNAVKYSQSDTINVKIDSTGKLLGLDITDNGIGFELEQVLHHKHHLLSGNGLKNIQKRVEELKGELKISTEPGKGTKIALHFDPNKTPVSH